GPRWSAGCRLLHGRLRRGQRPDRRRRHPRREHGSVRKTLALAAFAALPLLVSTAARGANSPATPAAPQSTPAAAESKPAAAAAPVRARTFTIRYRNPGDVALLVQPLLSPAGFYTLQPALRTLTVQDTEAVLARIADVIASFDVPPRNLE